MVVYLVQFSFTQFFFLSAVQFQFHFTFSTYTVAVTPLKNSVFVINIFDVGKN